MVLWRRGDGDGAAPGRCIMLLVVVLLAGVLAACGATAEQTATPADVEIVDDAGRHVVVPAQIDTVFGTDPVGTTVIYTLAPEKMVGWNYTLTPTEKAFMPDEYQRLPDLGGWYGKSVVGSVEELIAHHIDVFVMMIAVDATAAEQAERIEQATGRPVVVLDCALTELDHAYEVLGGLLGEEERAARLGAYCRETVDEVVTQAGEIPEAERTSIYYAEGLKGLETDPQGSIHTEVISLAGGGNIADVPSTQGGGRTPVSLEQVLAWDPDLIIVGSNPGAEIDSYAAIRTARRWASLRAVKSGEVFEAPHGPFDWLDRPYSVNRVIGLQWLAKLLYPGVFTYDIAERAREFYELFYHVPVTDEQLDWLLQRSTRGVDGLTPLPAPASGSETGAEG